MQSNLSSCFPPKYIVERIRSETKIKPRPSAMSQKLGEIIAQVIAYSMTNDKMNEYAALCHLNLPKSSFMSGAMNFIIANVIKAATPIAMISPQTLNSGSLRTRYIK